MVNGRLPGRPGRSPGRAPGRHGMREIRAVIDAPCGVYLDLSKSYSFKFSEILPLICVKYAQKQRGTSNWRFKYCC